MTDQQPELLSSENQQLTPEEQARREAARQRLAEMLEDPQFRAIEGFPIGEDEDILALSDPPYYTACPNPFLPEIIAEWQQERETLRKKLNLSDERYQREPFAADVSEGKNDPIYNAHSYHTKVPHKAIMRYILHYTDPGDIVFDGFCGTGMTGVAAQFCGDKKAVEELGYRVDDKGIVWDGKKSISRLGARKAVLNDLSPAAAFIAYNYNTPVDNAAFEREAKRILKEVEQEYGWMYETWHPHCDDPKRVKGKIVVTLWSDVYACPQCGFEMVFWDVAVDIANGAIREEWSCPSCSALLSKATNKKTGATRAERVWEAEYDKFLRQVTRHVKQAPVLINYSVGNRRFDKKPDSTDLALIEKIRGSAINYIVPTFEIPKGDKTSDPFNVGITHVHEFFTHRNLIALAFLNHRVMSSRLLFLFTSLLIKSSKLCRPLMSNFFAAAKGSPRGGWVGMNLAGTLYVASIVSEASLPPQIESRSRSVLAGISVKNQFSVISNSSSTYVSAPEDSIDYIFVDPPFGSNLMYSELSVIWEGWLRVVTNNHQEAIMNNEQRKGLPDYQKIMESCFSEFYRILKPGRWITIEFHNSRNSVWNAIQGGLLQAGFIVADVRTLDKQQGSYNQYTSKSAVKQDLVISAYKPNGNLEKEFKIKAGSEDGAWDFVRYHLGKLPITNMNNGQIIVNAERQAFLLFDRMVAFHIQRGVMVPMSAPEFYAGLQQRFVPRDGMYFLPEQVAEYDRAVLDSNGVVQLSLFVKDEKTAIQWLRMQLDPSSGGQPQTHADLNPKFILALHQAKHEKAPELIEILEQNFLQDEEGKWYQPDHNRASDLERVRLRGLLREFNEYASGFGRLRQFRTEAIRAGFADAYKRQEYEMIIKVAGRLPEDVLREDPDLLMYYDSAMLRKK